MVSAFEHCQAECRNVQATVESLAGQLRTQWQSDEAAPKFMNAIAEWQNGFVRVQQGLNMLNENMQTYSSLTATTESTVGAQAGTWADFGG